MFIFNKKILPLLSLLFVLFVNNYLYSFQIQDSTKGLNDQNLQKKADEILTKYTQAIGGIEAINNIKSIVARAKVQMKIGKTDPFSGKTEIYTQKGNKRFESINIDHLDSKEWIVGNKLYYISKGGFEHSGIDSGKIHKFNSELFKYTKLDDYNYPYKYEGVKNNEFVISYIIDNKTTAKLYFDIDNYLLKRSIILQKSNCCNSEEITQYKNYKKINNIMLPTNIKYTPNASTSYEMQIEYAINEIIEESVFEPKIKN